MSEILESAGAGTAAGGIVGWLVAYLRNKDMKKEITDAFALTNKAINDKMDLITSHHSITCSLRTDSLQQQLDDFKSLQIRMDLKLDKLIQKGQIV